MKAEHSSSRATGDKIVIRKKISVAASGLLPRATFTHDWLLAGGLSEEEEEEMIVSTVVSGCPLTRGMGDRVAMRTQPHIETHIRKIEAEK